MRYLRLFLLMTLLVGIALGPLWLPALQQATIGAHTQAWWFTHTPRTWGPFSVDTLDGDPPHIVFYLSLPLPS